MTKAEILSKIGPAVSILSLSLHKINQNADPAKPGKLLFYIACLGPDGLPGFLPPPSKVLLSQQSTGYLQRHYFHINL